MENDSFLSPYTIPIPDPIPPKCDEMAKEPESRFLRNRNRHDSLGIGIVSGRPCKVANFEDHPQNVPQPSHPQKCTMAQHFRQPFPETGTYVFTEVCLVFCVSSNGLLVLRSVYSWVKNWVNPASYSRQPRASNSRNSLFIVIHFSVVGISSSGL